MTLGYRTTLSEAIRPHSSKGKNPKMRHSKPLRVQLDGLREARENVLDHPVALKAIDREIDGLEKKLAKERARTATLADGSTVTVGDDVWQITYYGHVYVSRFDGEVTKYEPQVEKRTIEHVSPKGKVAFTTDMFTGRPVFVSTKDMTASENAALDIIEKVLHNAITQNEREIEVSTRELEARQNQLIDFEERRRGVPA